jgi:hypothetical protein
LLPRPGDYLLKRPYGITLTPAITVIAGLDRDRETLADTAWKTKTTRESKLKVCLRLKIAQLPSS